MVIVALVPIAAAGPRVLRGDLDADETRRLRAVLGELGLPELAEPIVEVGDWAAREGLAAAHALEGARTGPPHERSALLARAEHLYSDLIAAREKAKPRNESDRLALARCRVAVASTRLRCSLAPDLDRFEITSGLAAPRDRLLARLDACIAPYERADVELSNLEKALAANEERFLLLGLADPLRKLHRECLLNLSWANVWRAAVENKPALSVPTLTQAVRQFDALAVATPSADERYSARLGMAAALRLLRRFDDALAVLEKLEQQNPPYPIAARARYERGRALLAAGRYADARTMLKSLADVNPRDVPEAHAAARFYLLLAPALIGDACLLEAAEAKTNAAALRRQGIETLTALVARGGDWPDIVDIYLNARGIHRDPTDRSAAELAMTAQRAMHEQRYDDAIPLWRSAVAKAAPGHARIEAQYNLAVSLFQNAQLAAAAETFDAVAAIRPADPLSESAASHAYRCRAQVANRTHTPEDWSLLAMACRVLLAQFPKHADAAQAVWVEPLALQEAHRYADAQAAYERFGAESAHYWEARRAAVACRQAALEARRTTALGPAGPKEWSRLADDWRKLAGDLDAAVRRADRRVDAAAPRDAELGAAEVLASDACGRYRDALTMLASVDSRGDLPPALRGRILSIRIRCHRGLGQFEQAAASLDEYLRTVPADQVGDVLLGLAASMESEVRRLLTLQRSADARRVAQAAVPTLRELLAWIEQQPGRAAEIPVVRLSMIRMMEQAGQTADALAQLQRLIAVDPANGAYLHKSAQLTEQLGRAAQGATRTMQLAEAEQLWSKLLADANLRARAPDVYWEARYHWLKLRYESGHADEVARGIAAEQAWIPSLGGAPWQGRLLELADQARRQAQRGSQP